MAYISFEVTQLGLDGFFEGDVLCWLSLKWRGGVFR
jgi:hypothetical protein